MKKNILAVFLFSSCSFLYAQNPNTLDKAKIYAATISAENLKKDLTYIASDELEGRDTGSEGQKKAADYIAKRFADLGLQPVASDGKGGKGYFQHFNLYKKGWKDAYIKIGNKKKEFFKDYYPNGLTSIPQEESVQVVFAGYGVEAGNYSDYKNLDVKNKAVVILEGEPKDAAGKSYVTKDGEKSEWDDKAGFTRKTSLAAGKGARMLFVVSASDETGFKSLAAERRVVLSRFNRMSISQATTPEQPTTNPVFYISKAMAAEMLDIKPKKFDKLVNKIVTSGVSSAGSVKESKVSVKAERGEVPVETMNVMGFLEGTDKKDEVVLVTAHYDHVGIQGGQIHNGADDDGSGTCAVLELARAFSQAKKDGFGPRRSILFMTVTGEEKGLLGSQYYADKDPVIPLANTVCDLNIDMIGRIDKEHAPREDYVYIIGSDKLSSELHQISEEANNNSVKFQLDYTYNDPKDPNRFYYRSDHYNFAKHKIPVAFYFTGVHADYHRPGDDVEKILFPKYRQITELVFHTAWGVANRDERLKVDSNKP
ncbi:M28 family peptidase [Emticicia fluvialis]|uniref:M28 family peptidase n=1 Tax=Emticicia fluvialis TaxID=2974474 RepID=UPI0021660716|nr:M28 family peptidase [Emticicia fluvialis]